MFSRRRSKAENKFTHFVAINKNIKRPAISCCLLWTGFSNARHLLWLISNDAAAQTPCRFKVFPLLWCGAAVCHCCLTKSTRRNDRRLELLLEALRQITISSAAWDREGGIGLKEEFTRKRSQSLSQADGESVKFRSPQNHFFLEPHNKTLLQMGT